jgi:erythronate-4-phosphate dehydrogenase
VAPPRTRLSPVPPPPSIGVEAELLAALGDRLAPHARLLPFRTRQELLALPERGLRALVVRTEVRVDAEVHERYQALEAVFTASAGRDHLACLPGVQVFDARGGNADGVADWVVHAVLGLDPASRRDNGPASRRDDGAGLSRGEALRVGVLGCGATGDATRKRLESLGFSVATVDPPRARREPAFVSAPEEALYDCDVLTLHVPLDRGPGPDRTLDWLDATRIAQWRRPFHLLNASRGEVVVEGAVLDALESGRILSVQADVFRHEPRPDPAYLRACALATPHVAGRSDDGRQGLQQRTLTQVATWLGVAPSPLPDLPTLTIPCPSAAAIPAFLERLTGFRALDQALKTDPSAFQALRATHRRRDWGHVRLQGGEEEAHNRLISLGFTE